MARSFTSGNYISIATGGGEYDLSVGSIAFWVNTSQAQSYIGLLTRGPVGPNGRPGIASFIDNTAGSPFRLQCKSSGAEVVDLTGTTNIRDGADHHCGIVFRQASGGTNRIFVGGAEEANGTASAAWTWSANPIRLGVSETTFWTNYAGKHAELAYWSVELNVSEWAALAKGVSPLLIRPQSLVSYWPLLGQNSPENNMVSTGVNATLSGTAKAAHVPVLYPAPVQSSYLIPAVGGGLSIPVAIHHYNQMRL